MPPNILIIESRREVAEALTDVLTSANYGVVVKSHVEQLADLGFTPAAIVVRIAFEGITEPPHAALERLMPNRPPVLAIASEDGEVAEAERLKCDIVLRAPNGVSRLCDALTKLVQA